MSRSRKKTPVCGFTGAESDKPFKEAEHRRERRKAKVALASGREVPHPKEFGDEWNSAKDGKEYVLDQKIKTKIIRK